MLIELTNKEREFLMYLINGKSQGNNLVMIDVLKNSSTMDKNELEEFFEGQKYEAHMMKYLSKKLEVVEEERVHKEAFQTLHEYMEGIKKHVAETGSMFYTCKICGQSVDDGDLLNKICFDCEDE